MSCVLSVGYEIETEANLALVHVPREKVVPVTKSRFFIMNFFAKIQPNLRSFYVHIGTLAFSFACYLTAYCVIGKNPNTAEQAIKLVLWYLPLFFEVAAHYYAMRLPGRVRYLPEAISARTSTVFIIILGGGKFPMYLHSYYLNHATIIPRPR